MRDSTKTSYDPTVGYHGEPSSEITAMIWRVAGERYPDDSVKQSAFNDGAHFLVQVMRQSCAEIVRLHGMLDATGAFTDKAAFGKFNADYTKAHRAANAALIAVLGEAIVESLHFQVVEADATIPYEAENA